MKPVRWSIADLFDLDFFLELDRLHPDDKSPGRARRDRKIFGKIRDNLSSAGEEPNEGALLKGWVEERRREPAGGRDEESMPGRLWREAVSLIVLLALGIGLLTGVAVCLPYLSYTGDAPLNVTVYFGVFVACQVLLAVGQLLVLSIRSLRGKHAPKSALALLLVRFVFGMINRLGTRFAGISKKGLQRLNRRGTYTPLSLWSAFIALQLVGVGFNLGIIGTTLAKVAVSDMAFGWQSTLQVQDQVLFQLVQWAAWPWSFFVPEHLAFPSLQAIEGSRIILKEGVRHLATADLVTWWPFLCLSVVSYGLLPRLLLLGFGVYRQRRELRLLPVVDAELRALLRRMQTPAVETGSRVVVEKPEKDDAADREEPVEDEPVKSVEPSTPEPEAVYLVPEELYEEYNDEGIADRMAGKLGWDDCSHVLYAFGELEGDDHEVLHSIEELVSSGAEIRICILQEGWQPPIEESLAMLRRLRDLVGEESSIILLLLGKPRPETIFTPASAEHLAIWRMKLDLLNDSNIEVRSY